MQLSRSMLGDRQRDCNRWTLISGARLPSLIIQQSLLLSTYKLLDSQERLSLALIRFVRSFVRSSSHHQSSPVTALPATQSRRERLSNRARLWDMGYGSEWEDTIRFLIGCNIINLSELQQVTFLSFSANKHLVALPSNKEMPATG